MPAALLEGRRAERSRSWAERLWRAAAYLLLVSPIPALAALAVALPAAAGKWDVLAVVALPVLALYLLLAILAAPAQRRAVVLLGRPTILDPHVAGGTDRRAALWQRLSRPATGRELAHALAAAAVGLVGVLLVATWIIGSIVLIPAPLWAASGPTVFGPWTISSTGEAWAASAAGTALLLGGAYAVVALSAAHASLSEALLGARGDELHERVTELTRSRLRLIDAFDVERRRIERDLHDGAQQQLVALAMTLDLAGIELKGTDAQDALRLIGQARTQAQDTLADLRSLIHAIHPPILAERGLRAALLHLADSSPLPVHVQADLPGRLPESIETAAYFTISEAVTNAVKHSGADTVEIDATLAGDRLRLRVRDDGHGGADPRRGTGLAGLGDRIAAVGGHLALSSPPGGPTVIRAEIPLRPGQP